MTISLAGMGQKVQIDSLKQLISKSANDTTTSRYLWRIADVYLSKKHDEDSALFYAKQGYALAGKHNYLKRMWTNLAVECEVYQHRGNYQKALRTYLDFLQLCEANHDIEMTIRVIQFISELYIKIEDYQQALVYELKNRPYINQTRIFGGWKFSNLYTIGIAYINLNQPDSALAYFQQGFSIANAEKSQQRAGGWLDQILVGLGMANQRLGNYDIAAAYYDEAIRHEERINNDALPFAYLQKAQLMQQRSQQDSAIAYYQKALQLTIDMKTKLTIYKALANIYLKRSDALSATKYFSLTQQLSDSLFTSDKMKAIEALTYNERERQKELENTQKEELESHKKNVENILIAIGIISFLIMFLLLSRSIVVNEKWIRPLGVVGLLLFFEFINLLLHPQLEQLTHHSSILMLLIMVGIAALLVPFHHKIEKLVTEQLIEKNKQIRIRAAHKTLERLQKPG